MKYPWKEHDEIGGLTPAQLADVGMLLATGRWLYADQRNARFVLAELSGRYLTHVLESASRTGDEETVFRAKHVVEMWKEALKTTWRMSAGLEAATAERAARDLARLEGDSRG